MFKTFEDMAEVWYANYRRANVGMPEAKRYPPKDARKNRKVDKTTFTFRTIECTDADQKRNNNDTQVIYPEVFSFASSAVLAKRYVSRVTACHNKVDLTVPASLAAFMLEKAGYQMANRRYS